MSIEADTLDARCEEFSKFEGEWLLLSGDQLVAHSAAIRDIQTAIKDHHLKNCLLHYVPTLTERDFILL